MKFLLKYLEILFTAAGLVVIFLAVVLFVPSGMSPWRVAAITATLVGVIHGVLFWLVRRRQLEVRRVVIADVQDMLKDIINNQLNVILAMSDLREVHPKETARAEDYITKSVGAISEALKHLSEDSLRLWIGKYRTPDSSSPFDPESLR